MLAKTHPLRYELHREFLSSAKRRGYIVFAVVEPGYPKSYLEGTGVCDASQTRTGMGHAFRQGLRLALESREYAAYSEPEKVSYVPEIVKTVRWLQSRNADLVVPGRATFAGYPPVQRETEMMGNEFFRKVTHRRLDAFFGPLTIAQGKASVIFLSYKRVNFPEKRDAHDAYIVPIMECIHRKLKVVGVRVNYTHPREQLRVAQGLESMVMRYQRLAGITSCLLKRRKQLDLENGSVQVRHGASILR
jgi:hypothetical protein